MSQGKICVFCLHENDSEATECAHCHAPFQVELKTPVVPSEIADLLAIDEAARLRNKAVTDVLALHIVSEREPIRIPHQGRIILGRNITSDDGFTVDLKPYRAHLLGVSRQHAALTITDDECLLEDLNSMNGTWLNETKLNPNEPVRVQDGDLIRLGLLLMFISRRG